MPASLHARTCFILTSLFSRCSLFFSGDTGRVVNLIYSRGLADLTTDNYHSTTSQSSKHLFFLHCLPGIDNLIGWHEYTVGTAFYEMRSTNFFALQIVSHLPTCVHRNRRIQSLETVNEVRTTNEILWTFVLPWPIPYCRF